MRSITNWYEAYMTKKRVQRGTTRIIKTTLSKHWNKYEVADVH